MITYVLLFCSILSIFFIQQCKMQNLVGFFEILMILWFCCFLAANARRYEQTLVTRIFPIANSVYFIAIIKKKHLLIVIKIALCITNRNGSSTCLWARISTEKLTIYSSYHIFLQVFPWYILWQVNCTLQIWGLKLLDLPLQFLEFFACALHFWDILPKFGSQLLWS